ncbi:MAG: type II secretion system protein [Planctomycetota bacterium]|jgi:prepilin-type N-terminal cleavage/methylation domain-containing protein
MVNARGGFTLIELLVVIAIIAVLMSILMPALNRAKLQAQSVIDQSNQHQFALIFNLYTEDNDGFFPERGSGSEPDQITMASWPYLISDYMPGTDKDLWFCPAATKPYIEGGRPPYASWNTPTEYTPIIYGSYGANYWISSARNLNIDRDPAKFWQTPNIKGCSYAPLLIDCTWKDIEPEPYDPAPPFNGYMGIEDEEMKRCCINRHSYKVNASFLDLSVKTIELKCLWNLKWHKKWKSDALPEGGWPEWMAQLPDCY